jgi:hypothetical protein
VCALLKGKGENKLLGRNVENLAIAINITMAISEKMTVFTTVVRTRGT